MKLKILLTAKCYGKNEEHESYSMYSDVMHILDVS